jgi:hypothetical protein
MIAQPPSIALFAPEHHFLANAAAVPTLTGYLLKNGYPTTQRCLDNELYSRLASMTVLHESMDRFERLFAGAADGQIQYMERSIRRARLPKRLNLTTYSGRTLIEKVLARRSETAEILHEGTSLLIKYWIELAERMGKRMSQLACAVDFYFAPYWPQRFSLSLGAYPLYKSSQELHRFVTSENQNAFIKYYRDWILPSVDHNHVLLGISVNHISQLVPGFTLASLLKQHCPRGHVTIGGSFISLMRKVFGRQNVLFDFCDSFVFGPGERSLATLHDELSAESPDLHHVPNLSWRTGDGNVQVSENREEFSLAEAETPVFTDERPHASISVRTSIGCHWGRCKFCHFPQIMGYRQYHTRPIEQVWRDIEVLNERHKPLLITLTDDDFTIGRVKALIQVSRKLNPPARLYCFLRVHPALADPEFCRQMREAGFVSVQIGLESGSQALLDRTDKGIDLRVASKAIRNLDRAGIIVNVFLIARAPTETDDDRRATIEFLREHLPYIRGNMAIAQYELEKHSPIMDNPEPWGLIPQIDPAADLDVAADFVYADGTVPPNARFLFEDRTDVSTINEMFDALGIPPGNRAKYDNHLRLGKELFKSYLRENGLRWFSRFVGIKAFLAWSALWKQRRGVRS